MRPAVAAALLLPLAAACARRQQEPPATARIVIGQPASAVTLDPHGSDQTNTASALSHFYEALVDFGPEMELRPQLAERWENPSDTLLRLHLRRGVLFHDGRPFTAEDAVFSLEHARRPESHVAYQLRAVSAVRATDPLSVEIETSRPVSALLNRLVFVRMLPRQTYPGPIAHPLGTGPYAFAAGAPGATLVGRRFENYWGERPAFDEVRVLPLPESGERAAAVASGRADVVAQFPSESWKQGAGPGARLVSRRGLAVVFLGLSQKRGGPFADPRVRTAIALAVDREAIVREAMDGLGAPLDQVVPPWVAGYSSALPRAPVDREKARALLVDAGLPRGLEAPLVVQDIHADVGQALARQLAEIGVRFAIATLPQREFYDRWSAEELPASLFGWAAATGDALAAFEPLLHSPAGGLGRFNRFSYANAGLDALIEACDAASSLSERSVQTEEAARQVRADWPIVPLVLRNDLYAVRDGLEFRPRLDRRLRAMDLKPSAAGAQKDGSR